MDGTTEGLFIRERRAARRTDDRFVTEDLAMTVKSRATLKAENASETFPITPLG